VIRFFRVNDPYRLVVVLFILVIVRVIYGAIGLPLSHPELKYLLLGEWLGQGFAMYTETFDYTAPLSAWTYELLDKLFGRSRTSHWVVSTVLVFLQAAWFNRSLINNKVFAESNYVPSFLYVVFSVATFDFFALSPQLMSLTWVVISIDHLIRKMDNEAGDELFMFPGFYLGIAALFYFPATAFFVVFLLALIVITQAQLRRILLFVFGYATAFFIVIVLLYFSGSLAEFWNVYFIELTREKLFYFTYLDLLVWGALPTIIFFVALFKALGKREGSLHAKTQQFMLLVFMASGSVMLLSGTLSGIEVIFFVPVFTFFISNYIFKIRRKIWRVITPNVLILGALVVPYLSLTYDSIQENLVVRPSTAEPAIANKRIMIIGPIDDRYLQGAISSPFIDEGISKVRLDGLDYYHKAPIFLEIIKKAQPEIVVDAWSQMDRLEHRFPEVEAMELRVLD
jgi:hypothetical protein